MDVVIGNAAGERLDYSFAPGASSQRVADRLVIFGHGVTGNKDRPVVADTAAALNAAGFDTLRVSFSGNGGSEGDFRAATISKAVSDLDAVLNVVAPRYGHLTYIGHSMGGAVGVLKAARDPRVAALVSLAGMVDTRTFALAEFGEETPDDGSMWGEADCPLSAAFMEDLTEVVGNVEAPAEQVTVPWLLLHGTADDVVLPRDTERVQAICGERVTVRYIYGADHSFSEPSHKAEMVAAVVAWLTALAV